MTTLLRKAAVVPVSDYDEGTAVLAEKSHKLLGYYELKYHLAKEKDRVSCGNMVEVLNKMQVFPYDKASVKKYKKRTEFLFRFSGKALIGTIYDAIGLFCFASLILTAISCCWFSAGFWVATSAICTVVSFIVVIATGDKVKDYKAKWKKIPIKDYDKLIPEFALQTAVDLKERIPSVSIYIEELIVNEVPRDPFLVATDASGNEFYLEVWNEPKFRKHS